MKKSERIEKVKELYFKDNLTIKKIAKKLKSSVATINRDIKYIKDYWKLEFNPKAAEEIIQDILQLDKGNIEKIKAIIEDIDDLRLKAKFFDTISKINKELFDKLARTGIITTTDNKLELSGNIRLEKEFEEVLNKVMDKNEKKK